MISCSREVPAIPLKKNGCEKWGGGGIQAARFLGSDGESQVMDWGYMGDALLVQHEKRETDGQNVVDGLVRTN